MGVIFFGGWYVMYSDACAILDNSRVFARTRC